MIPNKPKPCKSKCGASGFFGMQTKGMCYPCYSKWLYETDEGRRKLEKAIKSARIKREKEDKEKRVADRKKKMELKKSYAAYLLDEIQKIARLIDHGQKCLARDKYPSIKDGGHVFAKGGNPSIKYNLHNIFLQGRASNHFGNEDRLMHEGLERVFGKEYRDFNDSLRGCPKLKYTEAEYAEFLKVARKVSRELSSNLFVRTPEERINERNKYNLIIGIYSEPFVTFKIK